MLCQYDVILWGIITRTLISLIVLRASVSVSCAGVSVNDNNIFWGASTEVGGWLIGA